MESFIIIPFELKEIIARDETFPFAYDIKNKY